ncbi:MAG: toxin-antitoxin system YwqK family antitoxin [Bacteroidetes bacterium]|nr:toxin-antitoxin system YwqK family antitoxin [Bacteroidota bacterium]
MKKGLIFVMFLGCHSLMSAQNVVDQNKLKQGHWVFLNQDKKLAGYRADQKVEEGDYVDNLKDGKWLHYFNNEKVKEQLTYQRNLPNGPAVFYYPNGNKKEEGTWKNGQWIGVYKFYYENGQLANEWNYNNSGNRTGEQKYYYENGKVRISGEWINGKENGSIKEYYENGDLKSEKIYQQGNMDAQASKEYDRKNPINKTASDTKLEVKEEPVKEATKEKFEVGVFDGNGMYQLKDREGRVAREGLFENGALVDGKVFQYGTNGKITKTLIYKGGKVVQVVNE